VNGGPNGIMEGKGARGARRPGERPRSPQASDEFCPHAGAKSS
jgi:hypothetical protein